MKGLCLVLMIFYPCARISESLFMPGYLGPTLDVPPQVQKIVDEVKSDIKGLIALRMATTDIPRPVKYRAELTPRGTNFYVKMKVREGSWNRYFLVKIFKPAHWNSNTAAMFYKYRLFGVKNSSPIEIF